MTGRENGMRYLLGARVRPDRRAGLLGALEAGTFGEGFPYGDLGEVLSSGRVDASGTVRWVEVCYCREYYGVAMHEELPYLEEYLTDIEVSDARSPRYCKGYPECGDCDCARKVRVEGEPLRDYLRRTDEHSLPHGSPDSSTILICAGPADQAYRAEALAAWIRGHCRRHLETTGKRPGQTEFEPVKWRWIVGRTFGWFGRYRRLSKDYEHNPASSEAWIYIAMIHRMSRFAMPEKNKDEDRLKRPTKRQKC